MVSLEADDVARAERQAPRHRAASEPFLTVDDAWFSYHDRQVLRGVDLTVHPGEIFVLLGPNGAGKSTLIRALAGRAGLERGTIRIGGRNPFASAQARRWAGFVPQRVAVFEQLTMVENLRAMGEVMGVHRRESSHRAELILKAIGLSDRAGDRAAVLSGGMRRRLNIGMALMHAPQLIVLDEPTVGVDYRGRGAVQRLIFSLRDQGLAVLLTTHDMEEAEALADRVGIIVAGEIMAWGPPRQLVERLFGDAKELIANLGPSGSQGGAPSTARTALVQSGFTPDQRGDQWRRRVNWSDGQISQFMAQLLAREAGLKELRVRRPGLDTVLAHYVEGA